MIKIEGLKKHFGDTCACDIPSFTINNGNILGLVGNNGAGKTTLFRLLLDLLKADEGSVTIDDINPAESEEWKNNVGAHIDEGFLIDFLTPEEYFSFLGKISGMTQTDVNHRLEDFERFAGGEIFGQKKLIRNLSAGNKQKVGIISALLRKPQTVILDEPFNFLDPTSQLVLKHLISDYARETHATVIISSHNLQHTVDISTRIALLEHGQIIRDLSNVEGSATAELQEYFGAE
ncbi:ABC-2 type transport system ATP-binding protein [Prevotella sp. tc2-28]|jgi:ABC-2 type transport system ATP-binding protein|uniref:ATP-binding cassette domain-containing protein n=1 Tax=Prevotella sp. tc2-28 TaxID=1761888 RepID=UPI0008970159|nr:ABC transporter ATP-binding protein [Prevotella sp. tc2-28]SEA28393.1 ABC-2 type transport system ATP-binding protein [Prevotella sp. tc2-28]